MGRRDGWTSVDRERLAKIRRQRGDTQDECAAELRRLGAAAAQQSDISNWELARTAPEPQNRAAIDLYCGPGTDEGPSNTRSSDRAQEERPGEPGDDDAFDQAIARLSGSPALSGRQAQLLDALIERLRTGPPLSPDDSTAVRLVANVLQLERRSDD